MIHNWLHLWYLVNHVVEDRAYEIPIPSVAEHFPDRLFLYWVFGPEEDEELKMSVFLREGRIGYGGSVWDPGTELWDPHELDKAAFVQAMRWYVEQGPPLIGPHPGLLECLEVPKTFNETYL